MERRKDRLTLAAIEKLVRDGYDLHKLLVKYGYVNSCAYRLSDHR